MNNLTFGDG
jgi:5-oxoprolinase (ATP-hydrolysing)